MGEETKVSNNLRIGNMVLTPGDCGGIFLITDKNGDRRDSFRLNQLKDGSAKIRQISPPDPKYTARYNWWSIFPADMIFQTEFRYYEGCRCRLVTFIDDDKWTSIVKFVDILNTWLILTNLLK